MSTNIFRYKSKCQNVNYFDNLSNVQISCRNIKKIISILSDHQSNAKLFDLSEDKEGLNKIKLEFEKHLNIYEEILKEKAYNIIRLSNEINEYNLFQLEKEILSLNREINIKREKKKLIKNLYKNLIEEIKSKNLKLISNYNKLNFFKKLFIKIKIINFPQEILELNEHINLIIKKLNSLNRNIKNLENEIVLSRENKKKIQEIVLKFKNLEKIQENYNGEIAILVILKIFWKKNLEVEKKVSNKREKIKKRIIIKI